MATTETANDLIDRLQAECDESPAVETNRHGPTTAPAALDALVEKVAAKLSKAARGEVDGE